MSDDYQWNQGPKLRAIRTWLGLSPKSMAGALGMSERSYTSQESGRAAVPAGVLDDVVVLAQRYEELIASIASRDTVSIDGMTTVELRAVGAAAIRNPDLIVTDERDGR